MASTNEDEEIGESKANSTSGGATLSNYNKKGHTRIYKNDEASDKKHIINSKENRLQKSCIDDKIRVKSRLKAEPKFKQQLFDFSDESDAEDCYNPTNLVPTSMRKPLAEHNKLDLCSPQAVYSNILQSNSKRNFGGSLRQAIDYSLSCSKSSSVCGKTAKTFNEDSEWGSVLNTPSSLSKTRSGKKKLFSETHDSCLKNNIEDFNGRVKPKNLFMHGSLAITISPESEFVSEAPNKISWHPKRDSLSENLSFSSDGEFVEVQDNSAQTSFEASKGDNSYLMDKGNMMAEPSSRHSQKGENLSPSSEDFVEVQDTSAQTNFELVNDLLISDATDSNCDVDEKVIQNSPECKKTSDKLHSDLQTEASPCCVTTQSPKCGKIAETSCSKQVNSSDGLCFGETNGGSSPEHTSVSTQRESPKNILKVLGEDPQEKHLNLPESDKTASHMSTLFRAGTNLESPLKQDISCHHDDETTLATVENTLYLTAIGSCDVTGNSLDEGSEMYQSAYTSYRDCGNGILVAETDSYDSGSEGECQSPPRSLKSHCSYVRNVPLSAVDTGIIDDILVAETDESGHSGSENDSISHTPPGKSVAACSESSRITSTASADSQNNILVGETEESDHCSSDVSSRRFESFKVSTEVDTENVEDISEAHSSVKMQNSFDAPTEDEENTQQGNQKMDNNSFYDKKVLNEEKKLEISSISSINEGKDDRCSDKGNEEDDDAICELADQMKITNISRRRRYSDSSDDDDAFDKFLTKLKAPPQESEREEPDLERSMSDFIDDDVLTEGESSESDSTDDELLHIQEENLVKEKRRRKRQGQGASHHSSPDCETDESDTEVKVVHTESDTEVKAMPTLDLSSDDDLLFDIPKDTTPASLPGQQAGQFHTPLQRKPKSLSLSANDDDDSNDFKTPFKTPLKRTGLQQPWNRQFKTPAATNKKKSDEVNCPMTISKFRSRQSNIGLDDDSVFLKSLSEDYPDYKKLPEASRYIKHFKTEKEKLTKRLFDIFNRHIFKEQLPADLELEWSSLYRKTAGSFIYKRSTHRGVEFKIVLSVKVCDRAERVRDTLVHEMCHAAVRLINDVRESHGPVWRSWAQKVNRAYPFMPVIARCHDYLIVSKYTYKCTRCDYRIGRHSKSLDTDGKVCGHCLGKFEVFLTRDLDSSSASTPATPRTPRTPNKFALFVKESYSEVKKKHSDLKHGDVMRMLSQQFAEKNKIDND